MVRDGEWLQCRRLSSGRLLATPRMQSAVQRLRIQSSRSRVRLRGGGTNEPRYDGEGVRPPTVPLAGEPASAPRGAHGGSAGRIRSRERARSAGVVTPFGSPRTGTNPAGVHVVPAFGSPRPGTNPAGRLVHVVPRPRSSRTRTNLAGCASPNRSSSQSLVSHSAPLSPAQRLVYIGVML
jgi:hypothetical protein